MDSWTKYVRERTQGENQTEVARRTGVSQSTIGKWLRGETVPSYERAAKFALATDGDVLGAFVAAGYLTPEQAGRAAPKAPDDIALVSDDGLVDEVRRRLMASSSITEPASTERLGDAPKSSGTRAARRNASRKSKG